MVPGRGNRIAGREKRETDLMCAAARMSLDDSAAQGPLHDCLTDLRDMGVTRVILTAS